MIAGQGQRILEVSELHNFKEIPKGESIIVTVSSGKGGTGKTFLALNMAKHLSNKNIKVLLIDFNFNFSNIDTLINTIPDYTIMDYFNSSYLLNEIIYKYNSNLHFIFGENGGALFENIEDIYVKGFLEEIKRLNNYDIIIVDTSPGITKESILAIQNANFNIIIGTTEPTSVLDTYAFIKLLTLNRINTENYLIFNKSLDESDAKTASENLTKALSHFLKIDLNSIGYITYDKEVMVSFHKQKIYVESNSNSKVSGEIKKVADKITVLCSTAKYAGE